MKNTELESLEEQAIKNEIKFSEKVVEIAKGFLEKTFTAEEAMKRITREATAYSFEATLAVAALCASSYPKISE